MSKLKILSKGKSSNEEAYNRGKLFEKFVAEIFECFGYEISKILNTNYAGMEIDIEGLSKMTKIPIYAECKCYENFINSPEVQKFFGKYMTFWLKDNKCQGLFVALPGVNSHARGFYKEYLEKDSKISVNLLEEQEIIEALINRKNNISPKALANSIKNNIGTPGDCLYLYTDKGLFCVQFVIFPDEGTPRGIVFFNENGDIFSDDPTISYLLELNNDLANFEIIKNGKTINKDIEPSTIEESIVEVRGSSSTFEYQFPASPEFFVGRSDIFKELENFIRDLLNNKISNRGLLFLGNSGWGKSSIVLSTVNYLEEMNQLAIAIDSRSAITVQFVLKVIDYTFKKLNIYKKYLNYEDSSRLITGFEGVTELIIKLDKILKKKRKLLFIFFDQFENIFFLYDALKEINNLLLKICDIKANIVFGFSWKSDIVGLTNEFPYKIRDQIVSLCKNIMIAPFSEVEIKEMLKKLEKEIKSALRKDLEFFLSEFSQGFPWLLKKLCSHVKSQRDAGVSQVEISNNLLKIEELFQEDLKGLSAEEESTLRIIAKISPISIIDFGKDINPEIVQSLINRRLIIRIGYKLDVYWDIFKDYLNSEKIPVQENYIFRTQVNRVMAAINLVYDSKGELNKRKFKEKFGLTEKSFYNFTRDMRLLGIVKIEKEKILLNIKAPNEKDEFKLWIFNYLKERLQRNRLIGLLIKEIEINKKLSIDNIAGLLSEWCPYISAAEKTWLTYARRFAEWMDYFDIVIYDYKQGNLTIYTKGKEVRERNFRLGKRRSGIIVPQIQYKPIEKIILRLNDALVDNSKINWSGFTRSTVNKSLSTLEDLKFINKKSNTILVSQLFFDFISKVGERKEIFLEAASSMELFKLFIKILNKHSKSGLTLENLWIELKNEMVKEKLNVNWADSTGETNVKIMLDWTRHLNIAPGVFIKTKKGPRKGWSKKQSKNQKSLF